MRKRVYLPFLALVLICGAWSVLWKITADAVGNGIDEWFRDEAAAGRIWTCADRSLGGYPFRIELRCTAPSFTTVIDGATTTGRMGDLLAVANAYQPSLIVAKAQSPLQIQSPDLQFELSWSDMSVSHHMKNGELVQIASEFDHPVLKLAKTGPAVEFLRADRFEVYARPAEVPGSLEGAIRAVHTALPLADRITGENDPLDLVARAVVSGAGLMRPAPLRRRLETWRLSGGVLEIPELKLAKGNARVEASGRFGLDPAHRPQGKLDLQATGAEPILKRLGIPTAAVALGSALSALLPGAKNAPAPASDGTAQPLKLPLAIDGGRISVGPIRTPFVVPPLY